MKNLYILLIIFAATCAAEAQIATGGNYTLDQSVSAAGGGSSANGQFTIEGTTGQSVAGQRAATAPFAVHAGFWNAAPFAVTAANVVVSGRVVTSVGRGIRNVRVTVTGADGESHTAVSTAFGYFRFGEIPSGATYIFAVSARSFQFSQPTQIRTILEDTDDIIFVADQ